MRVAWRRRRWALWLVGLLAGVSLACNMQPQPTPQPTATPQPQYCLPFSGVRPQAARPADPAGYQDVIRDFLNRGGSPADLELMLRGWGVIDDDLGGRVDYAHDLNGDRLLDVLVTLHYQVTAAAPQPPGLLLIFGCYVPGQPYQVLYGYASAPGGAQSMPQISYRVEQTTASGVKVTTSDSIRDITQDGLPEIIFWVEQCTRLACFREPIILTWDQATERFKTLSDPFAAMYRYTDDLRRPVRGLPNAGITLVVFSDFRPPDLIIEEGDLYDSGLAQNAPQREFGPFLPTRHTWTWNGFQYVYTAADPLLTHPYANLYIHILRRADQALRVSDLDDAIVLYQEAMQRGMLWGGIADSDANRAMEKAMLDAYARYRLVLAYTALRSDLARQTLTAMQQERPWQLADLPSHYTLLATSFYQTFVAVSSANSAENALRVACERVRQDARVQAPRTYEFLGDPAYFGAVLNDYTVEDLCPFE